jgi:EAL domain-containing protein (putative c-di-GMP-specific phosphodiesterase class I)
LWEIDRWVVAHAIDVIGQRTRAGEPTTLLVKMSQASLADDSLARFVGEQLVAHGVSGEHLVLQLPEAKVFTHLRAAQEFAGAVARHGCRVALEQFGVGLDSFQLLSHFDPAFIKLDRSFMEDLAKTPPTSSACATSPQGPSLGSAASRNSYRTPPACRCCSPAASTMSKALPGTAGPEMNYDFE